ncbi:response regulator transcription factor [Lachnospiraceae bacterium ZAX-1]
MTRNNEYILVVEDDRQIQNFICYALKNEGFRCDVANTGQSALSKLVSEPLDMMLLDLGLPDFDGIDVIKKVREWSEIPIMIVSARDQDKEKVAALDMGADDYLTKPFSIAELMARVRVALRHSQKHGNMSMQSVLSVDALQIDFEKHVVFLDGSEIHLTPMEYTLLSLLFKNMGKVLTTGTIIKEVWGVGYGNDTQALRSLMTGLRRKIEEIPAKPRYILTEIGVGYRLAGI